MYTEKYSKSSMKGVRMLGIDNVHRKNTGNRQCKARKCSEPAIYAEKYSESEIHAKEILGIGNVCGKMLGIGNTRK